MRHQFKQKSNLYYLYHNFFFALCLGSIGLLSSCKIISTSPELKAEEYFSVEDTLRVGDNSRDVQKDGNFASGKVSIYARKFSCVSVKYVELKAFYIKGGEVTTTTESRSSNTNSENTESSSCLFTLLFSSQFNRPSIDFAFPNSLSLGGSSNRNLPEKNSLGWKVVQSKDSGFKRRRNERLTTISTQTSLKQKEPTMIYLKILNSTPPYEIPKPATELQTVQDIKSFSNKNQDLEFLAVELTWFGGILK